MEKLVISFGIVCCFCASTLSQTSSSAETPLSTPSECPTVQVGCTPRGACEPTSNSSVMRGKAMYQGRLEIVCAATGSPLPDITWESSTGQALNFRTVASLSVLTLEHLRISRAVYHCRATNACGTSTASVDLSVSGAPPMARALTPHVVHYVGDSAVFRCSITGDPAPTVTWSSLLEEDIVDGVRFISIGDTLAISNLTMMDNGLYYCNGANRHGQSSASVALTVKAVPELVVEVGEQARLECAVSGTPKPFVTWHRVRDGVVNDTVLSESQTYEIAAARRSDSGDYVCRAVNEAGETLGKFALLVLGIPPYSTALAEVEVDAATGHLVELSCGVVSGIPKPLVVWSSQVSTPGVILSSRATQVGDKLVIARLQHADRGLYTCIATNRLGNVSVAVTLNVYDGFITGDLRAKPGQKVNVGSRVEISCDAKSPTEQKLTYSWTWESSYNDNKAMPRKVRGLPAGVTVDPDGRLIIASANQGQQGLYICRAEDSLAVPFVRPVVLHVYAPAEVLLRVPHTLYASTGQSLEVPCYVAGYPVPQDVAWLDRYGRRVAPSMQTGSRLVIKSFSREHAGQYSCSARNSRRRGMTANFTVQLAGETSRFFGNSFAAYPPIPSAYVKFNISLRLRTSTPGAPQLILINRQSSSLSRLGDFLVIYTEGGTTHAAINAGRGTVRLSSPQPLKSGTWHTINFSKKQHQVSLTVDSAEPVETRLPGSIHGLNVYDMLYIGGHPDMPMLKELSSAGISGGFTGCIGDVYLSKSRLDQRERVLTGRNVGQCNPWCESQCGRHGTCSAPPVVEEALPVIPSPNLASCRCQAPYKGALCDIPLDVYPFCTLDEETCPGRKCSLSQECVLPSQQL